MVARIWALVLVPSWVDQVPVQYSQGDQVQWADHKGSVQDPIICHLTLVHPLQLLADRHPIRIIKVVSARRHHFIL